MHLGQIVVLLQVEVAVIAVIEVHHLLRCEVQHPWVLNPNLLFEEWQLSQILYFVDELRPSACRSYRLNVRDLVQCVLTDIEVDGCVLEVAHVRDLVIYVRAEQPHIFSEPVLLQLTRESLKNWFVEAASAAVLLENLQNDVFCVVAQQHLLFEVLGCHELDPRVVRPGLRGEQVLLLVVQELLNELVQVSLDRIQEDVALRLERITAFLQGPFLLRLQLVSIFASAFPQRDPLLRVDNHNEGH